jgi:site-specific DNA-methyltransferase (adenine-specific)
MTTDIFLGDCLEVMKELPDNSVDMVLCDLPYGTTACKWDEIIPTSLLWPEYNRICGKGAFVLFAAQPFTSALVMSNIKEFKYSWIWEKNRPTGAQQSKNRPMSRHEDVLVFSSLGMGHKSLLGEDRMPYNPQGVKDSHMEVVKEKGTFSKTIGQRPNQVGSWYMAQTGFPDTILRFDKEESHYHPTQKPVDLLSYLIKTYTDKGMTILDNCMGSGSTGVACVNTERSFIGIEKDEGYFKIAERRIEDAKAGRYLIDIVD